MQGASPLVSPGLGGARHGLNLRSRHPAGAYPRRWWLDQPLRCLTGACLLCRLPTPPLVCFSAPIPPTPFPSGEGGDQGYFMQGASPLASPGLDGARHGLNLRSRHPAGASPRRWRLDQPLRCLTGGLPSGVPAYPAVSLLCFPHPPARARRALFPGGEGGNQGYFMQGASPLASLGLVGARHGLNLRSRHPAGASPRRWRLDQPLRCLTGACPAGYLLTLPLVYFVSPYPPAPFPAGRGRFLAFLCKGLRPLHPRGWTGRGTGIACGKPVLSASNGALAPAGAVGTRVVKSPPARAPVHRVCKCRRRFSAGVPGAKPPAK